MRGGMLLAAWLACCGLSLAGMAGAACPTPDPAKCTIPMFIDVVGYSLPGVADPRGVFTLTVRDNLAAPCAGVPVELDFCACSDMELDAAQLFVICPPRVIRGITNVLGQFTAVIVGAAENAGGGVPGPGMGCIEIRAGIPLTVIGYSTAVVYDQDGDAVAAPGVGLTDVVATLRDWGTGFYFGRSDLNWDGTVSLLDAITLLRIMGAGSSALGMAAPCATPCP